MSEFSAYKRYAICAAMELEYGADVVLKIKEAKTETEICRILATARERSEYV